MFSNCADFNKPLTKSGNVFNTVNCKFMEYMFISCVDFNQNLSGWCVSGISTIPTQFNYNTPAWILPNSKPIWGTCP